MSHTLTLSLPSLPPKKPLPKELQLIFQLPQQEQLITKYSSWLFRTALLRGHLYLTTSCLCFHASNPSDLPHTPSKSGILTRRHSRKLNKVVKSWFVLNQSILSWYPSSQQSYFPLGQIDLRLCTHIESQQLNSKHPTQFKLLLSDGKVFTFRSDTQQSRDEWIQVLSQSISASQHHGQNVKLVIPLSTIDLVEKCDSIQFAQTLRIKIKDNALVRPFISDQSSLVRDPLDDGSLNDYFFGFLQDSQAPYVSINDALNLTHQSFHSSSNNPSTLHFIPPHSSLPSIEQPTPFSQVNLHSIRDSTRFTISPALNSSNLDFFRNSPSSSQLPSGSTTPAYPLHPSPDEHISNSKLSTKINRIASSSNKFVGSPIRSASTLVKVHHPSPSHPASSPSHSPPCLVQLLQPASNSTPIHASPVTSASPFISSHQPNEMINPFHQQQQNRTSSTQSTSLVESHAYPPKDYHRLQYSTYNKNTSREKLHCSPQASPSNSPIASPIDPPSSDSQKPWGLLPGWLKSVPISLDRTKTSRGMSSQDPSDDDDVCENQLTARDQLKFQWDFNFLNPGLASISNQCSMKLLLKTKCNLIRGGSSTYGQIYLASPIQFDSHKQNSLRKSSVCFKGQKWISNAMTKMILPVQDLTMIQREGNKLYLITNQQHHLPSLEPQELWFEFRSGDQVKVVHEELNKMIEANKQSAHQRSSDEEQLSGDGEEVDDEDDEDEDEVDDAQGSSQPIMFQSSSSSFLTFKPQSKLHITCLTIGSRGDVQPYIALCQKLQLDGHKCRIASHGEYQKWVEGYGIEYYEIGGDPAELMKICVDNGMFTLGFLKEAFSKFRGWLDELLLSSHQACMGTDLLIESPSTMAGIHIAEALQIPYFRAFTMPWTRTKEYPHAFAVPDRKMGGGYNYMTYTVFDQVFWKAMSGQVNKWRKEKLGLKSTTYEKLQVHKVPFLYNFSPTIVPSPLDWFEWIHVTGYWFIDEDDPNKLSNKQNHNLNLSTNFVESHETSSRQSSSHSPSPPPFIIKNSSNPSWKPSDDLLQFLDRAKIQNKKVVYIGFGSIVVPDPDATSQVIIESIKAAGVYGIISKGWSERLSTNSNKKSQSQVNKEEGQVQINENQSQDINNKLEDLFMIFQLDSIPHDWLFPRIHAVCHHGGAGTTGASLRAGIPTIIKPFFGDQFFWAERVETLGIGASVRKLTVKNLTQALLNATTDLSQIKRAQSVGEQIRSESGAAKAVECIYRDLEYAKSLIKKLPKASDEIETGKSLGINAELLSRPTRKLSYSTYRKPLPNAQSSRTKLSKDMRSVSAGLMISTNTASDRQDGLNNTEQMDLMGSSLLILPSSDATITTPTTTTHTTSIDQKSIIDDDQNLKNCTGSSSSNPQTSSSEKFFDCDLEDSYKTKRLNDENDLNNKAKNEEEEQEQPINGNITNHSDNSTTSSNQPMFNNKTHNSTSDEDASSWDILSQGSKSGPSSNELSNSFDEF